MQDNFNVNLRNNYMEFSKLNNFYWFIRNARNKPTKRKYYRYVSVEKKRLIEQMGVDPEELRLYCCSLSGRQMFTLREIY